MEPLGLSMALACLLEGLRTLYADQPLKEQMTILEKSKNFDLDYLPNLDGVPREKPICLRGYVESVSFGGNLSSSQSTQATGVSPSLLDPSEELVIGKVLWQPPQTAKTLSTKGASADPEFEDTSLIGEAEGTNYITKFGPLPLDRAVYLTNDKGELVLLSWKDQLLLHNTAIVFAPGNEQSLHSVYRPSLFTNPGAWFGWNISRRLLKDKGRVVELGLRKGESYNFIGSINPYNGQSPNPKGAKLMMNGSIVTGEMKEVIMRSIDNQIRAGINKSRYCLIGCFLLSNSVLFYRKIVKPAQMEENIQRAQRTARK